MKHTLILLSYACLLTASAAVPLRWTVETSRATPAQFEAYQGETLYFEADLQSAGKPLEAPLNYSLFWQTNGMGRLYWEAPCSRGTAERSETAEGRDIPVAATNVLFATWLPSYDVGARVYNCFIGSPSNIYHAAFQLRLRPSPGAEPNTLPLPTPVIDFAKVRVLNPPWESGGTDEAKVREIAAEVVAPVASSVSDLESSVSGLASSKLDESDVIDPATATTNGPAADAKATKDALDGKADASSLEPINEKADTALSSANDANVWSMATYNFMTGGRTNCWFSGTNYVFGADAATRTRFAWEDGMEAATVPCSMALWEIRDGERQLVWDQRDWTAWYWSFKARKMQTEIQGRIDALGNTITNASNYAWAKRYASDGTPNPDPSTTFIDTPSVTLSPGMKWETVATVSGAAYWTIVGNGAVIGGSGTNAVLSIRDFESNEIMTVTKGEHRLAWLERGEITDQMYDEDRWVCFDMLADAEPVGYFSTTLESSDFTPQTDPNCPAQYRWEDIGGGKYRIHFLLKPGISSRTCFAKFQVEIEGQTIIRYNAGQEISGGLFYNGVKIAPDISGSPAVGTVIQWKVVR